MHEDLQLGHQFIKSENTKKQHNVNAINPKFQLSVTQALIALKNLVCFLGDVCALLYSFL